MPEQTLAAPIDDAQELERGFSRYQSFLVALLAFVQFTIILDFIIMSPLGAILMPALDITAGQFGVAVSAYAFSAGISGVLAAGFADSFDRKRFLLFFYVGFTAGTALCALAPNYHVLLLGRIVTGLFGGVVGSDRARHHHRFVSAASARPGDGLCANGVRRKPGARHSRRAFSCQSLELARRVRGDRGPCDRRDPLRPAADAAGE